jgi:glycosyltransferase involved in cell wall biosynthesis
MRLLLANHEFTISGASTVLFRLATHFRDVGHEVHIFPVNPEEGPMKTRYEAAGIPVVSHAALSEYDLALCNGICAAEYVLKIAPQLRVIWFVHEAEIALDLLLKHNHMIEAFAQAAAVVYQMPFQKDVLRSFTYKLDPAKFHVIPNGVEIAGRGLARETVPAKTRDFRAVQVGTLEPRKRPGDFIRAVAASGLNMEAVICGTYFGIDAEARKLIDAEPEKYRIIEGLPDDEVLAWMESADMFCLASGSETQGIAAYEAALLARPLLLSDLACYRDIFAHGRNCLMFPPGRVDMLAYSMAMYASSPSLRQEMGSAAQHTARRFSNAGFYAKFDTLLTEVAALPGPRN